MEREGGLSVCLSGSNAWADTEGDEVGVGMVSLMGKVVVGMKEEK
jgi:hypothetical protein